MKNLGKLSAAALLTLVLTVSSFAGQMETDFSEPPPPPEGMHGTVATNTTGQVDADNQVLLTGLAVGFLESILPLF